MIFRLKTVTSQSDRIMISSATLLSLLSSSLNTPELPSLSPTITPTTTNANLNKLLQIEAIKLIQISLDKLTSTKCCNYKENLYKNLFISKILNKSKLYYYQSIVNTLRYSLFSKLTHVLSTNKNFKYLISNFSNTDDPENTSRERVEILTEDDYINLIIKEAIDNLVNNNIVIDCTTTTTNNNTKDNDKTVGDGDENMNHCLIKRKFESPLFPSTINNDDDGDVDNEKLKTKRIRMKNEKENDTENNNNNNKYFSINVQVAV